MNYYVAGMPFGYDELYHHGILGQKWGVRRFQNDDGTLTAAGIARYGNSLGEYGTRKQGVVRKLVTGDNFLGVKRIGDRREARLQRKSQRAAEKGNTKKAEKLNSKYEAQRQKNIDRDTYMSKQSTGKLFGQTLLMGEWGMNSYAAARTRGESIGKAAVSGILANAPYVGGTAAVVSEMYKSKKNYGRITI